VKTTPMCRAANAKCIKSSTSVAKTGLFIRKFGYGFAATPVKTVNHSPLSGVLESHPLGGKA